VPASASPSPPGSAPGPWPPGCSAARRRSGGTAGATSAPAYRACWPAPSERAGRPGFPPLRRDKVIRLACLGPLARGLRITHWSSADLARQAVAGGIAPALSARTVRRILSGAGLQPHRTRSWKTARLDAEFLERATAVLWCYANARRLARRGIWVVCADEVPNFQVLERRPLRRAIPGHSEQQEFEYVRHGTTNVLVFLVVHSGRVEAVCLARNDAEHYVGALRAFRQRHRGQRGIYLIGDGGPSHDAALTWEYLAGQGGWWHPRLTPAHASWLNQAELLIEAFGGRYLKRASWRSRAEVREQVAVSWPEYNRLYAHPFYWHWTIPKMQRWFARHARG
jgi:DDE superfamily endonuclease